MLSSHADKPCGVARSNFCTPFPGKIGDGSQPALLASNADGIHSANSKKGPQVLNNVLNGNGDDGVAVHGAFLLVASVNVAQQAVTLALTQTSLCALGSGPVPLKASLGPRIIFFILARLWCG